LSDHELIKRVVKKFGEGEEKTHWIELRALLLSIADDKQTEV
jgi:hypothetical protein